MENVRLKTALHPQQIQDRLQYNPEIIEFHLTEKDVASPEQLITYIKECKSKGIRVYLHHPSKYKGQYLDIISESKEMRDYYDWSCKVLADICKQEQIKCVVHCHYAKSESSQYHHLAKRTEMRKRLEEILQISGDSFLWEDTIQGIFSVENPFLLSEIVKPLHLPLNIDISHSFIALKGDNQKLKQHLESYHSYTHYYHLVDSNGVQHDSLPLGEGRINWQMVKPYVKDKDFIFEIDLKGSGYFDCSPMIESVKFFNNL